MKSNPLFDDSTVTRGSNIQTKFELKDASLRDGEVLCLKVFYEGDMRCLEMSYREAEDVFSASLWLEHKIPLSYQFFIQRGGEVLYATPLKKGLALHIIMDTWAPLPGFKWKENFANFRESEIIQSSNADKASTDKREDFIGDLINKWGL